MAQRFSLKSDNTVDFVSTTCYNQCRRIMHWKTMKMKSTHEEFMEAKTPAQRKKYKAEYRDFLLSEMILAAMEEDEISVRKLAKLANVSPTIVQDLT